MDSEGGREGENDKERIIKAVFVTVGTTSFDALVRATTTTVFREVGLLPLFFFID